MTFRLRITDEAAESLLSIARWYAETSQSAEVAAEWYDGFIAEFERIEANPWYGSLAPENEQFDFELREIHYGSGRRSTHRALYRIVENTVEVLAIRHHAQGPIEPGSLGS